MTRFADAPPDRANLGDAAPKPPAFGVHVIASPFDFAQGRLRVAIFSWANNMRKAQPAHKAHSRRILDIYGKMVKSHA